MKRNRFTEGQIIGVLREHEAGLKTAEVCRKHGISEPTFYAWKAKFGGMNLPIQFSERVDTVAIPASTGIRTLSGSIQDLYRQFSGARRSKKSSAPGTMRSSRRGVAAVTVRGLVLATWGEQQATHQDGIG